MVAISHGRGLKFPVIVTILQAVLIVLMGVFGDYKDRPTSSGDSAMNIYPNFQDVNVMIFIGFGFLMTFLKSYGFSSVAVNMLIAVISIQWSALVIGFIHSDILGGVKFQFGIESMVEANFATATVLISFGAILGKSSPTQLLVMALFEVVFAQVNKYIGVKHLHAVDIGESMYLHMFGAYFGMAVARVLYDPEVEEQAEKKEGSVYHSDLFSMIGTVFLWIYWPSFNGGFAGVQAENAVVNTFLSLCACTVIVFAFSALLDENGKFDMVHVQNSTLAGGVAVGASANMPMKPFAAMTIGAVTGLVSVIGYKYITPFLSRKFKLHDTCGVNNLHGLPGWIAAIAAAILAATATFEDWGSDLHEIFPEIHYNSTADDVHGRTPEEQGGYQIAAAALTMVFAIVSGVLTGFILKLPIWNRPEEESLFHDRDNWNLPDGMPYQDNAPVKSDKELDTPM